MNMSCDFSSRIQQIIQTLGITRTAFAQKLSVTQPYITKLISGKGTPSPRLIEDICEKFDINETWFYTGEGKMFVEIPEEDEFFRAAASISKENDADAINMLVQYWKLSPESKKLFWDFIHKLANPNISEDTFTERE